MCGVFREREKKKKKSFAMELVQQQYVCGVFREREKKIFYNGTCAATVRVWCLEKEKKKSFAMELVLQHFLLSILMTTYIYMAFKILGPS